MDCAAAGLFAAYESTTELRRWSRYSTDEIPPIHSAAPHEDADVYIDCPYPRCRPLGSETGAVQTR